MPDLALAHHIAQDRDRILATLCDWLRIPSVSSEPGRRADVARSAQFAAAMLVEAGLTDVDVVATGTAQEPGAPAVFGQWMGAGPDSPTVLVYGHHDVQPADPSEWQAHPFEPVVSDGEVRARGAVDDKGQTLFQIEAIRGLLRRYGRLPVNVKVLVEGEEEVGSPNFERLLGQHGQRFDADVVVVSDTGMVSETVPSTTVGLRGLVTAEVEIRTAAADLHSGSWGGAVPNAAALVARLAAALHDRHSRVAIPGFYDRVRDLPPLERASLDQVPFDEEAFRAHAGVAFLDGEEGRTSLERIWTRPTAEVVGVHAGYPGPGVKTIVPARAELRLALRLVPDQDPEEVGRLLSTWVGSQLPPGVDHVVRITGGVRPVLTPVDHPAVAGLCRAMERVWGAKPLFTREGGSGPEEALSRLLQAPVLFLGVSLPGDRWHGPDERLVLSQFWRGLLAAGELLIELETCR